MSGFLVLRPGPQSLLQDAGRARWQHLGVSPCGPADLHAAAWANHLLGNPWGSPLLEVALGGLSLECQADGWVAVTGADLPISLDGQAQLNWSRFAVHAGQHLQLGSARSGQRGYLAVTGGFAAPAQLGSVATQQREGLGGLHADGRALQAGDRLVFASRALPAAASVPARYQPDYRLAPTLRVILGGDAALFAEAQLQGFFAHGWRLSPHSDRMGARLYGAALTLPGLPQARQWSQGVSNGAIQLPADGQPIILLADRQSMGGYPLLGWLHPLDLGRLAQCPAHHSLNFVPVSLAEAQAELLRFYRFFRGAA
ncbi:biotin-dependent carboxyltransferase family protein [Pseudomonas sp. N040]|uniref:5-oxoprolinase subunit C family protein n=1 Tax=Pseudomonas sp. N040 TaxID=2785325 RepID=UPI0018A28408|nr:biotin-dependent carboxyltransferase family protein [Pseudomonas sp. N040]MBF7730281.1 biotin-dependent carboxyltransferase family protein [Pseudomonas sp. N040]MBW7013923.1 biotin-dependent carboxyltransferase family protein [Pseudomonas sp. N040]